MQLGSKRRHDAIDTDSENDEDFVPDSCDSNCDGNSICSSRDKCRMSKTQRKRLLENCDLESVDDEEKVFRIQVVKKCEESSHMGDFYVVGTSNTKNKRIWKKLMSVRFVK